MSIVIDCSGYLVPCNKLPQKLVMQNSNHFIVFVDSVHWEFIQDTAVMTRPSDGKASVVTAMSDASAEMAEGWTQLGLSSCVPTCVLSIWWFCDSWTFREVQDSKCKCSVVKLHWPSVTEPQKSHSIISPHSISWRSHNLPSTKGRGHRPYLLMGRVSGNLQLCFETVTVLSWTRVLAKWWQEFF